MIRTYGSASSGITSGVGFAIAKTIASSFILSSDFASTRPGPESPMNMSHPSITSFGPPESFSGFEFSAYQRLIGDIPPST